MNLRPLEAELFQGDRGMEGQTDVMKLTVPFRKSENALKQERFTGSLCILKYML
jgi:hypothetical protein